MTVGSSSWVRVVGTLPLRDCPVDRDLFETSLVPVARLSSTSSNPYTAARICLTFTYHLRGIALVLGFINGFSIAQAHG